MSQNSNLNILMQKLYSMEKKLGVQSGEKTKKKDTDEFASTQLEALELLDYIKKKQDERDQKVQKLGNNPDTLRMGAEIKDKIVDLEKLIEKLNEAVRKQIKNPKKYSKVETDSKQKQYTKFVAILKDVKTREQQGTSKPTEEVKTITELKQSLMAGGKRTAAERGVDRDLNEDEKSALEEFAQKDKEQDAIVVNINEVLEVLKGKAKGIGDNVNLQTALISDLDKEVDEVNDQIQSSNAKLKRVLDEYRKPSKFCLDVCLMLLLMGSIGVLIKVLSW